jgi:membrane-associated phospholipid phosphatase
MGMVTGVMRQDPDRVHLGNVHALRLTEWVHEPWREESCWRPSSRPSPGGRRRVGATGFGGLEQAVGCGGSQGLGRMGFRHVVPGDSRRPLPPGEGWGEGARFNPREGSHGRFLGRLFWLVAWSWLFCVGCLAADLGGTPEKDGLRPDPYASMHATEIRAVVGLQKVEGLGRLMTWVSDLGPGKPMLAAMGLLLCLLGPRLSGRLAVMLILCLWLRELLAMLLQSPRPYWIGEGVRTFHDPPIQSPTFSLPSGHATAAAAFWFYLAGEARRRWAWVVAAGITLAVCMSRVYLGLHFVSDVVLGVMVGTLWVAVFRAAESPVMAWWAGLGVSGRVGAAVGAGVGLLVVSGLVQAWVLARVPEHVWPPYGATARASMGFVWSAGALCGLGLAWVVPVSWADQGDSWRLRGARLAIAAAPALFYFWRPEGWRVSAWLPADAVAWKWIVRFAAGAFMGWAAFFLLPRLWLRLGMVPAGTSSSPADDAR